VAELTAQARQASVHPNVQRRAVAIESRWGRFSGEVIGWGAGRG
jgi:hypothetical protein